MITGITCEAVPLASPMRNAYISFAAMTTSVVAVHDDAGLVGYGFNSNGRYDQCGILRSRLIPRLLAASPDQVLDGEGRVDPEAAWGVMLADEKPGGHGDRAVAAGAVDMALWDLAAKEAAVPLPHLLAGRYAWAPPEEAVAVYAAGGYYYPDRGVDGLTDELQGYLDRGYTRVKMKVGGAPVDTDRRRVEAALEVVGDGGALAVDANGRLGPDDALVWAEALAPYDLAWYEEPGDPLDYEALRSVAETYPGPLATGENLLSCQDTLNLARYAGLRVDRDLVQVDPCLSYGVPEYVRMLSALTGLGWPGRAFVPHGGHQFNLAVVAAFHLGGCESYPEVFAPFGGFADATPVVEGRVALPELPGVGFEDNADLYALLRRVG